MNSDVSTTMRARRVVFDDFNKAFSVESRIETLQRQIETRCKLTNVLNRSQECKLNYSKGKVEAARGIFNRKSESEMEIHRNLLKDHIAHREILDKVALMNKRKGRNSALGKYGYGSAKIEIQPLINKRVKETTPSATRRREAKKLFRKRKKVEVWDRTLDTPDLLNAGKDNVQNSRQNTQVLTRHLRLPAINKTTFSSSTSGNVVKDTSAHHLGSNEVNELVATVPSVFVTQSKSEYL